MKKLKYHVNDRVRVKTLDEILKIPGIEEELPMGYKIKNDYWNSDMNKYCGKFATVRRCATGGVRGRYILDITKKHYFTECMLKDAPLIDLKDSMEFDEGLL